MAFIQLNNGSSTFFNLTRVIAAQMVVFGHITSWILLWPKTMPPYIPSLQCVGVVIFFILSGFLIPYSTILKMKQDPEYSFKEFFIERFARIYTSLIPCLLLIFILDLIQIYFSGKNFGYGDAFNVKTFLGNLLMLEDAPPFFQEYILNVTSFGSGRPLWTLAIEWWIYFWFGYLFIKIYKNKNFSIIDLALMAIFSIVPYYNFINGRGDGLMLPWLMGLVLLFCWPYFIQLSKKKLCTIVILLFLSFLMFRQYRRTFFEYVEPYFVLILTLSMALILAMFHNIQFKPKLSSFIQRIADYSFTIYLIHYSIVDLLLNFIGDKIPKVPFLLLSFTIANLLSYLMAQFTEMKYKSVRDLLKKFLLKKIPA